MIKTLFTKQIGLILFFGALAIGLGTYKNYGISWDEGSQRNVGLITYNYLFNNDDSLEHFDNNVYGVGFELPLVFIEKALHLTDSRDIFLMRHLLTHLFFLLGALAFFLLIDYLYKNKLLATIGFLLIVVNPLIYGHSFFNTKDIPFVSMFMISFLIAAIAFNKNSNSYYILLGIACGLLTNMRIMGILMIGCIWLFFAIDFLTSRDKTARMRILISLLIFTSVSFLTLYLSWPYLYKHPIHNFIRAFNRMSKYPWEGDVLFWGTVYKSTKMPSYYGISWFSISNPIPYLALGLFGIIYFVIKLAKGPKKFIFDKLLRNQLLFIFCFAEPLLTVLLFHSVLYDAWRQLYFIYPAFILMGIFGLNYLITTNAKTPVLILLSAGIIYSGYYIKSNYPFEHVYFNTFAGKDEPEYFRKNFELDYWGTSYKQALEYIIRTDTAKKINVATFGTVGPENSLILPPNERNRINFVSDTAGADYFASIYRTHPKDLNYPNQVYSVKVLNSTLLSVFKLK